MTASTPAFQHFDTDCVHFRLQRHPRFADIDNMATTATALFPWRDDYSVGIPEIDNQHKVLLRLINDLHAAMIQGNGNAVMAPILDELVGYAGKHFAHEERMLTTRRYSGFIAHQTEHRRLTQEVKELHDKFRTGNLRITLEVMQFLKDWLKNHILGWDRRYGRELASLS